MWTSANPYRLAIPKNQWSPMPSPINPSGFFYPEVNVKNSIQTGELMVAKDGVMKFYCDKDIAKFSGSLTSPTINATKTLQVGGVDGNYLFAPMPPVLDNYMLESEVQSLYATKSSVNAKAPINNPQFTGTVSGITKDMVGLGNVDDTSDLSKPVSTAT